MKLDRHGWILRLPDHVQERLDAKSSGCVEWTGKYWGSGQPALYIGEGKCENAYRWIYKFINGSLPPILRHICDNRRCVNPGHLLPGTSMSNNTDASRRKRIKRKLTDREVQEIRWLIERGDRLVDIAPFYGVSPELVGHIKVRKRYHWLPWKPVAPDGEA